MFDLFLVHAQKVIFSLIFYHDFLITACLFIKTSLHICMNLSLISPRPIWLWFTPLLLLSNHLSLPVRVLLLPALLLCAGVCGLGAVGAESALLMCRCGEKSTAETFLGSEMVRWLQSVGLAADPGEALAYGSRLLEGRVIQHIGLEFGFVDEALHYRFT